MTEHGKTIAHLQYDSESSPTKDSLDIVRVDLLHTTDAYGKLVPDTGINVGVPSVVTRAWAESKWLPSSVDTQTLNNFRNNRYSFPVSGSVHEGYANAYFRLSGKIGWVALTMPNNVVATSEKPGYLTDFSVSDVRGYGVASDDVSGNVWERWYKRRFKPEKVYAKIGDVEASPQESASSQQAIRAALFNACLYGFNHDQVPTGYVFEHDEISLQWYKDLGYAVTGERPRDDVFPGNSLNELRLQGDTIGNVQKRLHEKLPWLFSAQVALVA